MTKEILTGKRDLVARVATLELLVADLVDLLWRIEPNGMQKLVAQADHDLEIQHNRTALTSAEHQRERLFTVLQNRGRTLKGRRGGRMDA